MTVKEFKIWFQGFIDALETTSPDDQVSKEIIEKITNKINELSSNTTKVRYLSPNGNVIVHDKNISTTIEDRGIAKQMIYG